MTAVGTAGKRQAPHHHSRIKSAAGPPPRDKLGEELRPHPHVASGGRLINIASTLPPVLRPNRVPRS